VSTRRESALPLGIAEGSGAGFTLAEMLIVVAVVALLATIALPHYGDHVRRSRIVEATSRLADHRVRLEQHFLDHRTYASDGACGVAVPAFDAAKEAFELTCAATASTYTVTATGRGTMAGFAYAINQSNARATTAVPPGWTIAADCWVLRRDGSCL
jgi:type IV pilus assembly protein PilE